MASKTSRLTARLLWLVPLLLVVLTINQAKVAYDLHWTLASGTPAVAEVLEVHKTNRVDVTFGSVRLRVPVAGQTVERTFPLPISLLPQVEDRETVDVIVLPGAAQEVVVAAIARPQWRMAASNAAMSFIGLVLATLGVFAWNRYLARKGDPADQAVPLAEA